MIQSPEGASFNAGNFVVAEEGKVSTNRKTLKGSHFQSLDIINFQVQRSQAN